MIVQNASPGSILETPPSRIDSIRHVPPFAADHVFLLRMRIAWFVRHQVKIFAIFDDKGKVAGLNIIFPDVTERYSVKGSL